jgi:DNA helicase-2/ATP-dependent DNA helicase PcrA
MFEYSDKPRLTDEQMAVVKAVADGESIIVNSVAGSGKTTVLRHSFEGVTQPFITLAFNVKIKNDLEKIVPPHGLATTINGLGHRMWMKNLGKKCSVDSSKLYRIVEEINPSKTSKDAMIAENNATAVSLANAAKLNGLIPYDIKSFSPGVLEDTVENWRLIANEIVNDQEIELARDLLRQSIQSAYNGYIDFNDQIYMSAFFCRMVDKFPVVLVDEAQDLSILNHMMLEKILAQDGQFVAVGDKNQSIYAFRGADADSMSKLQDKFNLKPMYMNYCFRCGSNIIEEAQKIVPRIVAFPTNPAGYVKRIEHINYNGLEYDTAFLARTNAIVTRVAYDLIQAGYTINYLGKELGKTLISLVMKVSRFNNAPIDDVITSLDEWHSKELKKAIKLGQEEKSSDLSDKVECIKILARRNETRDDLIDTINHVFKSNENGITVATLHRAKGLEWRTVYIVRHDFTSWFYKKLPEHKPEIDEMLIELEKDELLLEQEMNLTLEELTQRRKKIEQRKIFLQQEMIRHEQMIRQQQIIYQQELNLKYVGITRAKNNLYLVS